MNLISLLIYIIIFCVVAYGLWWVCGKFGMPAPVLWICGAILLIILLIFVANMVGVSGPVLNLPTPHR